MQDVMITPVVTVARKTPQEEVARLMKEHDVDAVPVLADDGHVVGMVANAHMPPNHKRNSGQPATGTRQESRRKQTQTHAGTAGELMTTPAITIHPSAPLGTAARLMNGHNTWPLPVVEPSGKLIGIISRRDLISVLIRPDQEVATEVRDVIASILGDDGDAISVTARRGAVTLSGSLAKKDLIPVAVRLAEQVDGVISVNNRLTSQRPAKTTLTKRL